MSDWTHFDAIRDAVAREQGQRHTAAGARLRDRIDAAREALERSQTVRMRQADRYVIVHTPAHFVDAWEVGYRP